MRSIVFYSPSRQELQRCSASRDKRSKNFLQDGSSIKFQTVIENTRNTTEDVSSRKETLSQTQMIQTPGRYLPETKNNDNRKINPQKITSRIPNTQHYLPTLAQSFVKERDNPRGSPQIATDTTNEMIENTLLRESRSELTRIYNKAREFSDLKLVREKERLGITRDGDRINAGLNKLSDDVAHTLSHNVQNIRTDISHYFNEKRSKSPEQNMTLPEIKDQFKKKFNKLLHDINDESKLGPEKQSVIITTNRGESNLFNNTLRNSRFFACDISPRKRNKVFTALHNDIRSVKTPMMKARLNSEQASSDKSRTSNFLAQSYSKVPGYICEFLDDSVLQKLRKELPNLFSSNPSNRQEVLVLGNWLINTIKEVQENEQLSKKNRFYMVDEMYNLCFNELIRQVSFDCIERAELLMKIWKAYISLSEDIIDDFKERERLVIARTKQECDKLREIHQKLLEDKDRDIEKIKEELKSKDDLIKVKNERIERFDEDQSENITQAKQASIAFTKIQKLYLSLKQEHKDINFKFEKIKKRLAEADLAKLDRDFDITSEGPSDDEKKKESMFGTKKIRIIRTESKETTTDDLMEWARTGLEVPGISTQTDLLLMHRRYNPILRGNDVLDDILREKAAHKKLLREGELIENMNGSSLEIILEKRRGSNIMETRRSSIMSQGEEKAFLANGSISAREKAANSQVFESAKDKPNYKINIFSEQQVEFGKGSHDSYSAKVGSKTDIRRGSATSTRSDRALRMNNDPNQLESDRVPLDNISNTADSEEESVVDLKDKETNHKDFSDTVNDSVKTESDNFNLKVKKPKIEKRNSVREASTKVDKLLIKRENSTPKDIYMGSRSPTATKAKIKKAGSVMISIPKKKNVKKATEINEPPLEEQNDHAEATHIHKHKPKTLVVKIEDKADPEGEVHINSSRSYTNNNNNMNSLAGSAEDFKYTLRQNKSKLESPAKIKTKVRKNDSDQQALALQTTRSLTVNANDQKAYNFNVQLLSPITMRDFPTGQDLSPKSSAMDVKAASARLDDSPKGGSYRAPPTARENRPIKKVTNAIKAVSKIASIKKPKNKTKAPKDAVEALAQVTGDNEATANLIESQEQKIIKFTNLYKIEQKKQEDLRALNRELEQQIIKDGVIIETLQGLIREFSAASEATEIQKRKVGTLTNLMEGRSRNLEAIDEMKPRVDPAYVSSIIQSTKAAVESPERRLFEEQFILSNLLPESKYKGDLMVDVVLSSGQKFLIAEKINNPVQTVLAKIKRDVQARKAKADTVMPMKSLLRQITIFYHDKVHQGKDNPMFKEQDMDTFVYKQFINTYGLGKFAVQKFMKFVTSLQQYRSINRINNFAKMMNVLDTGSNYSVAEMRQYLLGVEFLIHHSTVGTHYPNPDHQKVHYIPCSRALEYLRFYTEIYGQEEDLYSFKNDLERLRIVDPSRVHASGLIDVDIFLEKMVARYNIYKAKSEEALLAGFASADFLKEKKVRFAEFLVLYKAIEGDRNNVKQLEEAFVSYCDILDDDCLALSKEKFITLSFDYNIFSKQKLNSYLGVRDDIEFEKKFEIFRGKWEEEVQIIKTNIDKCQSVLPHEVVSKWRSILEAIERDMEKNESYIRKSVLVRHQVLTSDIAANFPTASG